MDLNEALIVVLVIAVIAVAGWYAYSRSRGAAGSEGFMPGGGGMAYGTALDALEGAARANGNQEIARIQGNGTYRAFAGNTPGNEWTPEFVTDPGYVGGGTNLFLDTYGKGPALGTVGWQGQAPGTGGDAVSPFGGGGSRIPTASNGYSSTYIQPAVLDRAVQETVSVTTDTVEAGLATPGNLDTQVTMWNRDITEYAIDPRTLAQHQAWSAGVAPFSQGSATVDNLDEALAMSAPRTGINAFRSNAPVQGPCTLFVTERDPLLMATQFPGTNNRGGLI